MVRRIDLTKLRLEYRSIGILLLTSLFLISCQEKQSSEVKSHPNESKKSEIMIKEELYSSSHGPAASLFTISNQNGMSVSITNYGGIITHLTVDDIRGIKRDVVLGFDSLDDYQEEHPYFGALIGRYANRIAEGRFALEGVDYSLAVNNGPNALHGGIKGFDKQMWEAMILDSVHYKGVELSGIRPDMEEGYPGSLKVRVQYLLNDENELIIKYEATTDRTTVVNLTNHSYFNLNGAGNGDILDHMILISADQITPVNESLIPTGEYRNVLNTPFDFNSFQAIGDRINDQSDDQIKFGGGYDHNFVLNKGASEEAIFGASVYSAKTGIKMDVLTTEPGVQFYTANFLDGSIKGKGNKVYNKRSAFCLETQHFPDSPNQPNFPTTVLKAGKTYRSKTIYRFSLMPD